MPVPARFAWKKPTAADVRELCALCDELEEAVLAKQDVAELLARWNARANREFTPAEFTTYSGAMSTEELVQIALSPVARRVPDLSYAEARAVFECVADATFATEAEHHYFLSWLEAQFPDSNVSDLIYWPDEWFGVREALGFELTPDQRLCALMEHSGRVLAGAPTVSLPFVVPKKKRPLLTPPPST